MVGFKANFEILTLPFDILKPCITVKSSVSQFKAFSQLEAVYLSLTQFYSQDVPQQKSLQLQMYLQLCLPRH